MPAPSDKEKFFAELERKRDKPLRAICANDYDFGKKEENTGNPLRDAPRDHPNDVAMP